MTPILYFLRQELSTQTMLAVAESTFTKEPNLACSSMLTAPFLGTRSSLEPEVLRPLSFVHWLHWPHLMADAGTEKAFQLHCAEMATAFNLSHLISVFHQIRALSKTEIPQIRSIQAIMLVGVRMDIECLTWLDFLAVTQALAKAFSCFLRSASRCFSLLASNSAHRLKQG